MKKYALQGSKDSYQNVLHRTFQQTMGTHTWAIKKEKLHKSDDDVDDFDETTVFITRKFQFISILQGNHLIFVLMSRDAVKLCSKNHPCLKAPLKSKKWKN